MVLHYSGIAWEDKTDEAGTPQNLYGVWGSSANDVFVVGEMGTILQYDGNSWTQMNSGTQWKLNSRLGELGR